MKEAALRVSIRAIVKDQPGMAGLTQVQVAARCPQNPDTGEKEGVATWRGTEVEKRYLISCSR